MRGFHERADVRDVLAWLDDRPTPVRAQEVAWSEARGRVLVDALVSTVDVPAFRRAAMDGWAVRGEDTFGAGPREGVTLRVIGAAYPGTMPEGVVRRGEAMRIMTGAPVPEGADAVLPAELGEEHEDVVTVHEAVAPKRHVAPVGEDVSRGTLVLPAGRALRPQDLGVAASIGRGHLRVRERPRVGLIVTGDELLAPGCEPRGVQIVDANTPMLAALVARDGATLTDTHHVRDDRQALTECLLRAPQPDVWLVTGGSSVGEEDHAPLVLAEKGTLAIHGIAMRPAAPTGVGTLGEATVFLLPGNPVSCLAAYDLLAGRLIRRLGGRDPSLPYPQVRGPLTHKVASVLGRVDYLRVTMKDGAITPLMARGASILSSTTRADGFVLVPRDLEGWPEDTEVTAYSYDLRGPRRAAV